MTLSNLGFEIIDRFVEPSVALEIMLEVEPALSIEKGGGIRNAEKKFSSIANFVNAEHVIKKASEYLKGPPSLVRAILFDKTAEANWLVSWHQDKTVAVTSKFYEPGWGPWSMKEGIHHVQPPLDVLENMITFRVHLDKADLENGCLRVIPSSHIRGVLTQESIQQVVRRSMPLAVEAPALSVLVMRPHLLHASSKASIPSRRRILHLEYSSHQLPIGINWA